MMRFRLIFLLICDTLVSAISFLRNLAALNSNDKFQHKNIYLEGYLPYDVVIPNKILSEELDNIDKGVATKTKWGDPYRFGVIVGYTKVETGKNPNKALVAYFNTAEFDKPKLVVESLDNLTILRSPLSDIEYSASLSRGLSNQDNQADNFDFQDHEVENLEDLFKKAERKKDDILH